MTFLHYRISRDAIPDSIILPEVLALNQESRILGQWSNPLSGTRKSQARSPWAKQRSVTCSIMEKPHTGLDECPRILLSCFRARNSALCSTVGLELRLKGIVQSHSQDYVSPFGIPNLLGVFLTLQSLDEENPSQFIFLKVSPGVCCLKSYVSKRTHRWVRIWGLVRLPGFSCCNFLPKCTILLEHKFFLTFRNVTCYTTDPWGRKRSVMPWCNISLQKNNSGMNAHWIEWVCEGPEGQQLSRQAFQIPS